ncbi:MAG: hypothetical protein QXY79_00200 [Candidatus Methanomethylicia archaeon]
MGLLFQITDDILDKDGLVYVMSMEELKNMCEKIYKKIQKLPVDEDLREIAKFVYTREK